MTNLQSQRGGTFLGFILGLVIGLGVALGVAMYVTKVPTPFSNKNQPRSAEQDAVESQKNKDWNPNSVLQPKAPASAPEPGVVTATPAPAPVPTPAGEAVRSEVKPAVQADPLGDLAKSKGLSTSAGGSNAGEPFAYFIQVGAYRNPAEAESQKAKMALMGLDAKVSEREQAGRTVYRVRLGPFEDKATADRMHTRLDSANVENTIVRIQR
jgi:cell division protein FtsN